MLSSLLSKSIVILSAAVFFAGTSDATCSCGEVCPSYVDGCWIRGRSCSVSATRDFPNEFCKHVEISTSGGGLMPSRIAGVVCANWCKTGGGCVCNMFGCNCDGCFCKGQRDLQSVVSNNATNNNATNATDCTDYYYYMNLTLAEKIAHFEDTHCKGGGLTASAAMVRKLEALADTNGNGLLSCDEFNGAYAINATTEETFCTVANFTFNTTTAPAAAPTSGPKPKPSAVMGATFTFQTFLMTAIATGIAFLFA
jgi:hypothetical protein